MRKQPFILTCIIALLFLSCSKEDEKVDIHCENLVNEPLPVGDPGMVFVANAFTPNNDGMNDLFRPMAIQINSISIKVFDKNSTLVFETNQIGAGWTPGPITANQTYYYRVEAVTVNNTKIGMCGELSALICFPANVNKSNYKFEDQLTPLGFTGVTNENLATCN